MTIAADCVAVASRFCATLLPHVCALRRPMWVATEITTHMGLARRGGHPRPSLPPGGSRGGTRGPSGDTGGSTRAAADRWATAPNWAPSSPGAAYARRCREGRLSNRGSMNRRGGRPVGRSVTQSEAKRPTEATAEPSGIPRASNVISDAYRCRGGFHDADFLRRERPTAALPRFYDSWVSGRCRQDVLDLGPVARWLSSREA